jgi:hypothetical protein
MLDLVSEADEEHDVLPDWVGVGVLPLQALFEAPGLPGAVRVLHVAPVRLAVVDRLVAAQSVGVEQVLPSKVHVDDEVQVASAVTRPVVEVDGQARLSPYLVHRLVPLRPSVP